MQRTKILPSLMAAVLTVASVGCRSPSPTSSDCPEAVEAKVDAPSSALPDAEVEVKAELGPLEVAVTVDDLPSHGPLPDGVTRLEIHERLLAAFAEHDVPRVYGFVNASPLAREPSLESVLHAWTQAGHPLGNHTYGHADLASVGIDAYLEDIVRNEPFVRRLSPGTPKVFRYPFLLEGVDVATTKAIRAHLDSAGYQIAEVTIDFYDWAWNAPYARCLDHDRTDAVAALRRMLLAHAVHVLDWADAAAIQIYGRRIPHVLLLHAGAFDAAIIDALLDLYEDRGVKWIALEQALEDPAYAQRPLSDGRMQGTLLELAIEAGNLDHPPWPLHPKSLLKVMCRPQPG